MALFSCGAPAALPKRIKKDVLEAWTRGPVDPQPFQWIFP